MKNLEMIQLTNQVLYSMRAKINLNLTVRKWAHALDPPAAARRFAAPTSGAVQRPSDSEMIAGLQAGLPLVLAANGTE